MLDVLEIIKNDSDIIFILKHDERILTTPLPLLPPDFWVRATGSVALN